MVFEKESVVVFSWGDKAQALKMAENPEILVNGQPLDLNDPEKLALLKKEITTNNHTLVAPVERGVYNHKDLAKNLGLSFDDLTTTNVNLPDIQRGLRYQNTSPLFRKQDPATALYDEQKSLYEYRQERTQAYQNHLQDFLRTVTERQLVIDGLDAKQIGENLSPVRNALDVSLEYAQDKLKHLQHLDSLGKKAHHAYCEFERAAPNATIFKQNNHVIHLLNQAALSDKGLNLDTRLANAVSQDLTEQRNKALDRVYQLIQDEPGLPYWDRFIAEASYRAPELDTLKNNPEDRDVAALYQDRKSFRALLAPGQQNHPSLYNEQWFAPLKNQGVRVDFKALTDTKSFEFRYLSNLTFKEGAPAFERKRLDFLQSIIALNKAENSRNYVVEEQIRKMKMDTNELGGKVPLTFSFANTQTGRDTTAAENQLNSHNMSKLSKSCLKASDGYSVLSMDFKSLEPRVLASFHNNKELIQAINDNKDVYLYIDSYNQVMIDKGRTPNPDEVDQFYQTLEAAYQDPGHETHAVVKDRRDRTKALVNAVNYGMGPAAMARSLGVTKDVADKMYKDFHQMVPEIQAASQKISLFSKSPGGTSLAYGGENGQLIKITTKDYDHYRKLLGDARILGDMSFTPEQELIMARLGHPDKGSGLRQEKSVLRVDWESGERLIYDDIKFKPSREMVVALSQRTTISLEPTQELCQRTKKQVFSPDELVKYAMREPELVKVVQTKGQDRQAKGTVAEVLAGFEDKQAWLEQQAIQNPNLVDISYEGLKGDRKELPQHTLMQNINQATAAFIVNEYTASVHELIKEQGLDVKLVGRTHDELSFIANDKDLEAFEHLCRKHQHNFVSNKARAVSLDLDLEAASKYLVEPEPKYLQEIRVNPLKDQELSQNPWLQALLPQVMELQQQNSSFQASKDLEQVRTYDNNQVDMGLKNQEPRHDRMDYDYQP